MTNPQLLWRDKPKNSEYTYRYVRWVVETLFFASEMAMLLLQTDRTLLDDLRRASKRYPSFDQIERQRLSFVMGMLSWDNPLTRDQVEQLISAHNGQRN